MEKLITVPEDQPPHDGDPGIGIGIHPILPILERVGITILSAETGFVACPGQDLHTKEAADKDCIVYNNGGVPRLYCFHNSCADVLAVVNAWLRAEARGLTTCGNISPQRRRLRPARRFDTRVDVELQAAVLNEFHWSYKEIVEDPDGAVTERIEEQWPHLIALFPDDAILWIGRDPYDSGLRHKSRFRTAAEWLRRGPGDGAFICPNSFKPGTYSRSNDNVAERHFLVVESDMLHRDQQGAIFRFLESKHVGMRLRAVVDTTGKSLHGWFDYPPATLFKKLRTLLPRLGCDKNMLKPSQPCRLPSAFRIETGRFQRLIYFH